MTLALLVFSISFSSLASGMNCVDRLEAIYQFQTLKERLKAHTSEEAILAACEESQLSDLAIAKKFRESRLAPVKAELLKYDVLKKTHKSNPYFKKGESKVSLCNWKAKMNKENIKLLEIYLSKGYDSAPLSEACRFVGLSVFRSKERPRKD